MREETGKGRKSEGNRIGGSLRHWLYRGIAAPCLEPVVRPTQEHFGNAGRAPHYSAEDISIVGCRMVGWSRGRGEAVTSQCPGYHSRSYGTVGSGRALAGRATADRRGAVTGHGKVMSWVNVTLILSYCMARDAL